METNTHSFVVRIWNEAVDRDGNVTIWRGSIDDVGSGKRLSIDDLDQIAQFIQERVRLKRRRSGSPSHPGTDVLRSESDDGRDGEPNLD